MSQNIIVATAGATTAAALSHAHTTSTTNRTHKRNWPTATKSAFYANFYAVVEATGATIG